ncbi:hypothetical protein [Bradyrhizobium sp. CW1]|uniref:hypothetical protein n=1 Tax=Bradyrhizobium sp. CW1 TaxID=2782686 RepID=UPI00205E44B6|nr:hypothetical protein IVB54_12310 [Bradyrhizobium sp. CW1]
MTPELSCCWTAELEDPVVVALAGGPFLLPGAPLTPVPEFCALGCDDESPVPIWPGMFAEPAFCSPTTPDAPELRVFTPLSASSWIA